MLRNRSTAEVLVILFASTVCFVIIATGATVAILEIRDSSVNTDSIVSSIDEVVQVLVGAVLGYLARGLPRATGSSPADPPAVPPERTEP